MYGSLLSCPSLSSSPSSPHGEHAGVSREGEGKEEVGGGRDWGKGEEDEVRVLTPLETSWVLIAGLIPQDVS